MFLHHICQSHHHLTTDGSSREKHFRKITRAQVKSTSSEKVVTRVRVFSYQRELIFNKWHTMLLRHGNMQNDKLYCRISFQAFHFIFELSFENIGSGPRISFNRSITGKPWQQLEKHSFGEQVHMLREEREKF